MNVISESNSLYKIIDFKHCAIDLLKVFKDESHVFCLDSSFQGSKRGQFSFIGFDPFDVFEHKGADTLKLLKEKYLKYSHAKIDSPSPLSSGIIGFLGYDYGLTQERIKLNAVDDLNLPDCFFGFYDVILTIDHINSKLIITSSGLPEQDIELRKERASSRLQFVLEKITLIDKFTDSSNTHCEESSFYDIDKRLVCNFKKSEYLQAVEKSLDYIKEGDIYQVNLSQRFEVDSKDEIDSVKVYAHLRNLSPAPFGGYLDCGNFKVISVSPERFLKVVDRKVETRPMKGTRPRGENPNQDEILKSEIVESDKDKAELLMITDLERNDLGRVCDYGSVKVNQMREVEEYSTVFQTTSEVSGTLQDDKDIFDLISAAFPGGSITGAPKIRAMEIIEELEPTRRGIYTGSLGYLSFDGNMDLNILIRTLLCKKNKILFQVGGGIVSDSDPEKEYQETLVKAKAIMQTLKEVL
ncbi:MAG: aminodeoxychorismate synthase component I [Candidatus Zapsychrus exili]|nr:aminodeoxychorismate synthase component I [Candidatus Zapsychrus exili]